MNISSSFDGGAIEVVSATDCGAIHLNIRCDSHADFRQWFYFRVCGAGGQALVIHLDNAASCTYHYGWADYQAVVSDDREHWYRVPTCYVDGVLTLRFTAASDSVWVAYFEPYPEQRHHDVLARAARHARVSLSSLGTSVQGREIDLLQVGEAGDGKKAIWIVARQHPGETMAEWCAEGLLLRLLDDSDALSQRLLRQAVVYMVPNINPDGAALGNLRSNAAGANLNREWLQPTLQRSPEVLAVRTRMHATGVHAFIDLHGDETIPHVFIDGNTMLPQRSPLLDRQERDFMARLQAVTPDFQTAQGYAPDRFSDEMLTLASKYVGHTFGCLALTLEMPFKDHIDNPHPLTGWSGARSKKLGADLLWPLLQHIESL